MVSTPVMGVETTAYQRGRLLTFTCLSAAGAPAAPVVAAAPVLPASVVPITPVLPVVATFVIAVVAIVAKTEDFRDPHIPLLLPRNFLKE